MSELSEGGREMCRILNLMVLAKEYSCFSICGGALRGVKFDDLMWNFRLKLGSMGLFLNCHFVRIR